MVAAIITSTMVKAPEWGERREAGLGPRKITRAALPKGRDWPQKVAKQRKKETVHRDQPDALEIQDQASEG